MRVQVDEAWAQHQPVPSDDLSSMLDGQIGANRGDPCTGHGHVSHQPGAVSREHPRAANQQVKARHGRVEPTPSTPLWRPAWREGDVRDGGKGTRARGSWVEVFAILLDDLDDAESVLLRQRGAPGTGGHL